MNQALERTVLGEGLAFSWVRDPKFKHNRISVNLVVPLTEETATEYALLPFLMRKGYRDCPDFTKLNATLDNLYGAALGGDVSKYSSSQVLELSIVSLDNRLTLEGEDLTTQCAELLAGVVCNPNLISGAFPETDVALEKQFLQDTIEAELNDKRSYALSKCRSIMCKGEPTAIKKYGTVERLGAITPASAAAAYQKVLESAWVEIVFAGAGDPAEAIEIFKKSFSGLKRSPIPPKKSPIKPVALRVQEEIERMELSQSKMVLGFRAGPMENERQEAAGRLMNAIFGATPFSKLFVNVREKLSLCYYCASRLDRVNSILMVDCGVEGANKEKAQAEILHQLTLLQNGEFEEEDLVNAKLMVAGALRSVTDSVGAMESWYSTKVLEGRTTTPAQDGVLLESITREEVVAAAKAITLDTVYLLTTKEAK